MRAVLIDSVLLLCTRRVREWLSVTQLNLIWVQSEPHRWHEDLEPRTFHHWSSVSQQAGQIYFYSSFNDNVTALFTQWSERLSSRDEDVCVLVSLLFTSCSLIQRVCEY